MAWHYSSLQAADLSTLTGYFNLSDALLRILNQVYRVSHDAPALFNMSNNPQHRLALRMWTSDSDPNYDWPTDPPNLRHIPYFQAIPVQLTDLVHDSSHRDTLDLSFAPSDCRIVSDTKNCVEACLNPESLFRLRNLKTCILMASASLLVHHAVMY